MVLIHLFALLSAIVSSLLLTWYVRRLAIRRGWMAAPTSDRHLHRAPVPRIGGVAIFFSFVLITTLLLTAAQLLRWNLGFPPIIALFVLLPGTLVFGVGLYDDFHAASPTMKFGMQAVAATLLYLGGYRVFDIPLFGIHSLGWLVSLPATIFWVLLITNAFNLIDGLDGLAAGSALFSTFAVFVLALVNHNALLSLVTIALAGATLGFLRFNFNPATIFLGDCGSLFLGFTLSALALAGAQKTPTTVAVAIPVVSFGLPIMDTAMSVFRRFLSGKPLFSADRQHIHHRLLHRGLTQRQVVLVLYAVSALCGLLSLFLLYPGAQSTALVLFVLGLGIMLGVQQLGYHEFFELKRLAQRTLEQKMVIANNLAIRRAVEMLADASDAAQLQQALLAAFEDNDFDGFELTLTGSRFLSAEDATSGCDSCRWQKADGSNGSTQPVWRLTLNLAQEGVPLGLFSAYRLASDRPLLLDINLVTHTLQAALVDTLTRLRPAPVAGLPTPSYASPEEQSLQSRMAAE